MPTGRECSNNAFFIASEMVTGVPGTLTSCPAADEISPSPISHGGLLFHRFAARPKPEDGLLGRLNSNEPEPAFIIYRSAPIDGPSLSARLGDPIFISPRSAIQTRSKSAQERRLANFVGFCRPSERNSAPNQSLSMVQDHPLLSAIAKSSPSQAKGQTAVATPAPWDLLLATQCALGITHFHRHRLSGIADCLRDGEVLRPDLRFSSRSLLLWGLIAAILGVPDLATAEAEKGDVLEAWSLNMGLCLAIGCW